MIEQLVLATMIPAWVFYQFVALLGAIVGSFLNVVIYRFHTGKSLNGRSHCLSCGTTLCWYELVPVASYAVLRGRCRTCRCRITPRYAIVELLTAAMFVLSAVVATDPIHFAWLLAVVVVLIVVTVYDYYHFIIPDELTVALTVLTTVWLGYQWYLGAAPSAIWWTILAAALGAAFFFVLWAVSRGRWLGFGDVKLAIPLGLWVGATSVFSFIVLSFWVGAVVSLLLLGYQKYKRGKQALHLSAESLTMKSAVPFAPFMIIGAALVYFFAIDVLSLFSFSL